jgi:hypothetical protein
MLQGKYQKMGDMTVVLSLMDFILVMLAAELSDELGNDKREIWKLKTSSSLMDGDQMP